MDPTIKVRAVCFCKDRYPIFKGKNNSSSTACKLKFFSQPHEEILINDKTVVIRESLSFEKSSDIKISDIKTIINECRLFEKVNIKAFVTEVSSVTSTEVYDKYINIQTALVYNKSGTSSITLLDMNCNQRQNKSSYIFTNLPLICLRPFLKTTEITTIEETNMEDIDLDSRL